MTKKQKLVIIFLLALVAFWIVFLNIRTSPFDEHFKKFRPSLTKEELGYFGECLLIRSKFHCVEAVELLR